MGKLRNHIKSGKLFAKTLARCVMFKLSLRGRTPCTSFIRLLRSSCMKFSYEANEDQRKSSHQVVKYTIFIPFSEVLRRSYHQAPGSLVWKGVDVRSRLEASTNIHATDWSEVYIVSHTLAEPPVRARKGRKIIHWRFINNSTRTIALSLFHRQQSASSITLWQVLGVYFV